MKARCPTSYGAILCPSQPGRTPAYGESKMKGCGWCSLVLFKELGELVEYYGPSAVVDLSVFLEVASALLVQRVEHRPLVLLDNFMVICLFYELNPYVQKLASIS